MSDRIRNRNHLRWVGALYFSFSLAASGWLHLRLHGIKKNKKIFMFLLMKNKPFLLFLHQAAASSRSVSWEVIPLLPPLSANNISIIVPCSFTAVHLQNQLCFEGVRSLGITDICISDDGKTSHGHWVKHPQLLLSFNPDKKKDIQMPVNAKIAVTFALWLFCNAANISTGSACNFDSNMCTFFLFVHKEHMI